MSLEDLKVEYMSLADRAKLLKLADPRENMNGTNIFLEFMKQGSCRYLLSDKFEHCGLPYSSDNDMNFSHLVHYIMCNALSRAEECGLANRDETILLGLSPYSNFGAEVMRMDNGYLILISPATISFCLVYAVVAISSMQTIAQLPSHILDDMTPEWFSSNQSDPRNADAFVSLLTLKTMTEEFSKTGTLKDPLSLVRSSGFGKLQPIYHERVQATFEHFITFLVLHELGHIVLGHMDAKDKVMRSIPIGDKEYGILNPLPSQEEEADDYALKALVGAKYREELIPLSKIMKRGDTSHNDLNKLWSGHTALGRYTSALLLMKSFDLLDTCYAKDADSGISFTNLCEVNTSHPSGQHRFGKAWCQIQKYIPLPEEYGIDATHILKWSNAVTLASWSKTGLT